MTIAVTSPQAIAGRSRLRAVVCALFAVFALAPQLAMLWAKGAVKLEDDAYFYLVIARNIVETGRSTFDQQTLTNGYHPLWQLVLVVQTLLVGQSALLVLLLELAMLTAALWLLLDMIGDETSAVSAVVAAAFLYMINGIVLGGMEVSLLVLCFMVLLRVLAMEADGRQRPVLVGLVAAATIGARIDAALFVVPLLLAVRRPVRELLVVIAVLAALGALYAGINLWLFGTALPISGLVKSLGGLQINHTLIATVPEILPAIGRVLVPVALCIPALTAAKRGSVVWALALAYPVGLAAYAAKLFLMSSWTIWSWYFFPAAFGVVLAALVIAPHLNGVLERCGGVYRLGVVGAAALIAVAAMAPSLRDAVQGKDYTAFREIYRQALVKYGPEIGGARVAIGDRAGLLGHVYPGPVTHLEGLVADKTYYDVLAKGGDVKGLLCRRGVRFLLDWEVDLGDYRTHQVRTLKDGLTNFPAPTIAVEKEHEVGRVFDLAVFDMTRRGPDGRVMWGGNHFLYIWRLGC